MIARTTFKHLPALQLADESVRLTLLPDWGGKVAEAVDVRRKREWLFENPALPYRPPEYGASYVRSHDVGGFDECFPTVGECLHPVEPWRGTPLPDHGEVWSLPWSVRVEGETIHLSVDGVRLPYRLEKSIRLLGNGRARFEYRAWNLAPMPMPFLWSGHALFRLRPGMRLQLPVDRVRVDGVAKFPFPVHHGDVLPWPLAHGVDLGTIPDPSAGLAIKLFTPSLAEGWAVLSDPRDGAAFRFEFDPRLVPHLGLWINYGGWAGVPDAAPYFNLGLEPCIGAPDSLDVAVNQWNDYGMLPPNGTGEWRLEMTLS